MLAWVSCKLEVEGNETHLNTKREQNQPKEALAVIVRKFRISFAFANMFIEVPTTTLVSCNNSTSHSIQRLKT